MFKLFLTACALFQFLHFPHVDGECGGNLTSKTGIIQTPNFPEYYSNNQHCIWNIAASILTKITLNFTSFGISASDDMSCRYGFLKIFATDVTTKTSLTYGPYCRTNSPGIFWARENDVKIEFFSSNYYNNIGFSAEYIIEEDNDECSVENGRCQHFCHNFHGGYSCSCLSGFQRHDNLHGCYVIDDYIAEINPKISFTRNATVQWFQNLRQNITIKERWGTEVCRIAIALYFVDSNYFLGFSTTGNEIAYEVDSMVLGSLIRDSTNPITETQMAMYIHALLVTCYNPRDFHGIDLISKLRSRVNGPRRYISPLVMLALCNAKDEITSDDIHKVIEVFNHAQRNIWTGTQALALIALSCMIKQTQATSVPSQVITDMSLQLKDKQHRNGSFENIYTTALIMQAIFASGTDDNLWSIKDAINFLINNQMDDGSYENFLNTYHVLPVLYHKSLSDISSSHCMNHSSDKAVDHVDDLNNEIGQKLWVKYSVWFGDYLNVVRSMMIRMNENCTFFDVMNAAEFLDDKYRFNYFISDSKPYVYALNGYQDDPENERFWFLYRISNAEVAYEIINSSPVDVIPRNKEEYVMWYRKGHWNDEIDKLINKNILLLESDDVGSGFIEV